MIERLSLEQKVRLLTGADAWTLHGEDAIGLRPLVMSDGPAGVRGTGFDARRPSSSLPCPVALGATWDPELVEEVAQALGREARGRSVDVLLAPTVNIVRTPLAGRGFECFSEDPLLTSRIAVAYVRGVQAAGVGATAKHFVANDSETDRRTYDARISETVLRELYLPPFEACVGEAQVALVMAAYNSVNGASMTAHPGLLRGLLKTEWEFPGVVVSDWSAARTTAPSALAGLDLVMPGPHGPWGERLVAAVRAGRVPEAEIDDKVVRLLGLSRWIGPNGQHPPALIDPGLLRRAAGRSFVLLSNPRGVLPLAPGLRRVALIGPNAVEPQTQGGGSVRVLPVVRPGLAEALREALGDGAAVSLTEGCLTSPTVAAPAPGALRDPLSGEPGLRLEVRDAEGALQHQGRFPSTVVTWWDGLPAAAHAAGAEIVMRGLYRAAADGDYQLGAAGVGLVRLSLDGALLAEARTVPPRDVVEAFSRPPELRAVAHLRAGQEAEIRFAYRPDIRGHHAGFASMRLGVAPLRDDDQLLAEAAAAAAGAEVALVIVGSPEGSESEGYDRETLALAGRQDELVRRVAAANPNTVVVVNSGMPVLMPWAGEVAAVIQAWFPGQAFGEALADVLTGSAEPGGRLPLTLPISEADSPVLHAQPEGGELDYAEGLLVGYRGFDRRGSEPRFAFGHGLGYTDWTYESLALEAPELAPGRPLAVRVSVRNTGSRAGREVVQIYVEPPDEDPRRPLRVLAGFAAVGADPGASAEAVATIPARLFAGYDEELADWAWRPGTYKVWAGRSSRDLRLSAEVRLSAAPPPSR